MRASAARLCAVAGGVVLLDQLTKFIVMATLPFHTSRPVIGNVVRLTYIKNQGIAFGLLSDSGLPFAFVSIAAMLLILFSLRRLPKEAAAPRFAMAAILGGAAGNLIDRVRFGEVVDFIDIGIAHLRWPVFNFADVAVTTGVCLFVVGSVLKRDEQPPTVESEAGPSLGSA
ncbi:MAG: signal peptidase II [bacterium]